MREWYYGNRGWATERWKFGIDFLEIHHGP